LTAAGALRDSAPVTRARGTKGSEHLVAIAAMLVVAGLALQAHAEPDAAQKALATKLFNEGKELMTEERIAEACAKLAESQRLDPAPGTILNLAVCHEKQGRTATAWAEYCDARVAAQLAGRADRVAFADQHARALEPKLSHLLVSVRADADLPGLSIRRDGGELPRDAWGTPLPVDPGVHVIEASALDRTLWRIRVEIRSDADLVTVVVPPLAKAPLPATPALAASPVPNPPARVEPTNETGHSHGRRNAAIALGAAGLVSAGVGAYFGLRAISERSEADSWCPFGSCTPRGASLNNSAKLSADIATTGFAVGLASLAGAAYLAWTARSARGGKTTTVLVPSLTTQGGAVAFVGSF
jgi:hypothetical protein